MARTREQTLMLTGSVGYNRTVAPDWRLSGDRLVTAINVWLGGTNGIAERRLGSTVVQLPGGVTAPTDLLGIVGRDATSGAMETWILLRDTDATNWYLSDGALTLATWDTLATPADAQTAYPTALPDQYAYIGQKVFLPVPLAYHASLTTNIQIAGGAIKRVGLTPAAAAPTVADQGSGTYAAAARYYRVRWTTQVSGTTVRRSEPSTSVSFTPSGSGASARVTVPTTTTAVAEGATHWEVEGSTDDATYYVIATVAIGTTTYDDTALVSTYSSGTLSDAIGEYAQPPPCVTVCAHESYLLYAGNATYPNRVYYSVPAGTRDVGDEECFPPTHYLDIEADDKDRITAMAGPVGDVLLVFKQRSVFRLVATGSADAPYEPIKVADIGCLNARYVTEGPPRGRADGEAVYWANREGAWVYAGGAVSRISDDILAGTGTDYGSWGEGSYRVVYYEGRQSILFGRYAYSLWTGGWSYISSSVHPATCQIVTRTSDVYSGRLIRIGETSGLYVFDDYVEANTATTDAGTAIVGVVQFPRLMPFGHGARFVVSRCRIWGQMLGYTGGGGWPSVWTTTGVTPGRVQVRKVTGATSVTDTSTTGSEPLAVVTLTGEPDPVLAVPSNLGAGPVDYLGLLIRDDQSQRPWRLHALELSVIPQEPLV